MATQQDATVNIHVNNQEAEEKVKELSARARQLRQEFAEAVRIGDKGTIAKTEKELKKVNKELDNARLRAARVRESMKHISEATPKELRTTLKLINQELNSGAVKRGSKEWKQYQAQLKQVNAELRKIKAESREVATSFKGKIANIANLAVAITSGMQIYDEVIGKLRGFVNAYAEQDAAMANTQKFTGMTREEVEKLNEEMKNIDTRTPLIGLNELAQSAGRLGKNSVEDVMGFVKAGDIIGVAMDELGAEAPEIISKLAGIFNLESEMGTEKAMLSVGSAVNTLSQKCAAGAPNLVEFASRMGAVANQSHMTMDEMLAFGAVLDSNNVTMEKGSTAMQGVITKMYANPAKFAKAAGIDVQEFTDALKRSSTEGIMMFVDALSKMDQMQMSSVLSSLGTAGSGVVQTFQTLAGKTDELKLRLSESKQAFDDATSATEEFNIQNNTVEAQLEKSKEKFNQMAAELGEHLVPVMRYAISGTSLLMKAMKVLIGFVVENKKVILLLTVAIASYTAAVKFNTIAQTVNNAITKAGTILKAAWTATTKLASTVVALFSMNISKATVSFKAFSAAIKANPIGLLTSLITTAITSILLWNDSLSDAAETTKNLTGQNQDLLNKYTDISEKTAEYAQKELSQLNELYNAATNEALSKEKRINAANNLKKLYPDYFSKMSTEIILAGKAKNQYDNLTQSILATAKARAAADLIAENEKEILKLGQRNKQLETEGAPYKKDWEDKRDAPIKPIKLVRKGNWFWNYQTYEIDYTEENAAHYKWMQYEDEINLNKKKIKTLEQSNQELKEIVASAPVVDNEPSIDFSSAYAGGSNYSGGTSFSSKSSKKGSTKKETKEQKNARLKAEKEEKDRQEAEKKERERKKKAEEEANDIVSSEYLMIESNIDARLEFNRAQYTQGLIDYRKFTENQRDISLHALTRQREALEEGLLTETDVYKNILEKETKLKEQFSDKLLNIDIDTLEIKKKQEEDALTSQYLDSSSPIFQNETAYRQKLFELDVKFLQDKQKLYAKDSEEWLKIENEIQERLRADQIAKQQETADALLLYQEEYGKASGSQREKMELDILDNLHQQGLITEEEYNKARNAIREKYRTEDREKERTVQSEYADMVVNLYDSFKKFFDELGKDGTNFWENLSNASQAAFAVMGAALSQYSAYADAERDLELAQVEHRYDAEIEKVGKNNKKKEQLEKQKEAKIAAIKKKYNERAMKIEMANAVAQTALAAISAYASGSQVNVFLGPIASALALAAGAVQIATIKKQHQAEAIGYYEGGYTGKALDNHKEVGVVHANEFVANHKAVANPRLRPLFNLLDSAQRNNTVGSLTAQDVSNALGQGRGVTARAEVTNTANEQVGTGLALVAGVMTSAGNAIDRLNKRIDDGIETVMIMDGDRGFAKKYEHYQKLSNSPKR